jgi:hypothetical protein
MIEQRRRLQLRKGTPLSSITQLALNGCKQLATPLRGTFNTCRAVVMPMTGQCSPAVAKCCSCQVYADVVLLRLLWLLADAAAG